jgi:hypothetical protein
MFLNRHNVLYGGGDQTVVWTPRHNGEVRIATGPTYAIYDYREGETSDDREVVAPGTAATVGAETESLIAAAGPSTADAKMMQVADESDFSEGHIYLLTEAGQRESFVLDRLDATNHRLYSTAPLGKVWTTAAVVSAVELQGTFPLAEAADETEVEDGGGPYGAVWTYKVDGEQHNDFQELWLVRYMVTPWITESDIKRADPRLATMLRSRFSLTDLAILATESYTADVRAAGKDPTQFFPSTRQVACRYKALEIACTWRDDYDAADRHREDYLRIMNSILVGVAPFGTVGVDTRTDTAPAGTDTDYTPGMLRRS